MLNRGLDVILRVEVPGKVVLLGEYAVLEGAPAMVAAVNRHGVIRLRRASHWSLTAAALGVAQASFGFQAGQVYFEDPAYQTDTRLALFRRVVAGVLGEGNDPNNSPHDPHHDPKLLPCHIDIDTSAFLSKPFGESRSHASASPKRVKLGLGSSAAVTVGLVVGLKAQMDMQGPSATGLSCEPGHTSRQALLALSRALHAEGVTRGSDGGSDQAWASGSGVDLAACIWGGLLTYQCKPVLEVTRLKMTPWVPWLALDLGRAACTFEMLQHMQRWKAAEPHVYKAMYRKLGMLARAGVACWRLGQSEAFLKTVDAYCDALEEMGRRSGLPIVSAQHADLRARVRQLGGSYKPSGAGGGDVGLAFCPTPEVAWAVETQLSQWGYAKVPMQVDMQGVRLHVESS